jgi:tRNA A-37 threonylcarbamoyl transferase component Bud32
MIKYIFYLIPVIILLILINQNKETFKLFYKTFKLRKRNRYSGLIGSDSFLLEKKCIDNLSQKYNCECKKKRNHFPSIKSVEKTKNKKIIEMTHLGESINKLSKNQKKYIKKKKVNFKEQISCILNNLKKSETYHNDMHKSGKNLIVNKKGDLSLIDFNIANTKNFYPVKSNGIKLFKRTLDSNGKIRSNKYNDFYDILKINKLV